MFKKSLDKILASFNRTIDDLEALAERNRVAAGEKRNEANVLLGEANALGDEAAAASKVANSIRKLVS